MSVKTRLVAVLSTLVAALPLIGTTPTASAQAVGVDWASESSGTLNGTTLTLSGPVEFVSIKDLTGPEFAAAPLSIDSEIVEYSGANTLTVTFASPVSDLLVYAIFWQGLVDATNPIVYTFGQSFSVLSGMAAATVSGGGTVLTLPEPGYHSGVLRIPGAVSSLTITSSQVCPPSCSLQGITFGLLTGDADGDGVDDAADACAATVPGDIVDADGCSIAQRCPCDRDWKNHGTYVSCVSKTANAFAKQGLIGRSEKRAIMSAAARSQCGNTAKKVDKGKRKKSKSMKPKGRK